MADPVDDVTRAMSKGGGVLVKNLVSAPGPPLSKILDPPLLRYVEIKKTGPSSAINLKGIWPKRARAVHAAGGLGFFVGVI